MKQEKLFKQRYFYLQSIGLLPLFLLSLANNHLSEIHTIKLALFIGLVCSCIEIFHRIVRHRFILMFGVSTLTLLQFSFLKLVFYNSLFLISNTTFLGILLFINLVVVRGARGRLFKNRSRNRSRKDRAVMSNIMHEFMYMSRLLLYVLSFYLAVTIIFNSYAHELYPGIYDFLNYRLNLILMAVYFIYECIRIILLNKMLSKETWLPIINESLSVIGRIEKQESFRCGNRYLHPHVRGIIMCGNKIYLQPGQIKRSLSGLCLDTPISADLWYGEVPDDTLRRVSRKYMSLSEECTSRRILSSKFKTDIMNRVIMLYILNVPDESYVINKPRGGKFWTPDQIDAELNKGVFSACFEQEYEFLKNTILLALEYAEEDEKE